MTTGRTRQVVFDGPGRLQVADADPLPPGAHDLVIRPDAVGICGTDLELLDGTMAYLSSGIAGYPLVPGHEWTGVVAATGSHVTGFGPGDRVVGECSVGCGSCDLCAAGGGHLCRRRAETGVFGQHGALTTRLVYPARTAHRVPDGVSADDAALIEPLAVACRGLSRLDARAGEALAVVGAGTIGLLCALTARAFGITDVHIVEMDRDRRLFAESLGFSVFAESGERRPRVLEASGTPAGAAHAMSLSRDGGTVVLLGLTGEAAVPVDLDRVVVGDLTVRGSLGSPGVWPAAIELVSDIRPSRLVTHHFPLDGAPAAFDLARHRGPGVRKILIHPHGDRADA